jgi:sporulation protein YlmC with PRC-barrel domain
MNANELMGLTVVDSEHGTTIGIVKGLLIDQDRKILAALEVSGGFLSHSRFVPFESIQSVEHDVLMVPSAQSLVDRQDLGSTGLTDHLTGRRVFTEDGKDLGTMHSYSIDSQTGEVSSITFAVDKDVLGGLWKSAGDSYDIPGGFIRTLGEHIIVDSSVPEVTRMIKAA